MSVERDIASTSTTQLVHEWIEFVGYGGTFRTWRPGDNN